MAHILSYSTGGATIGFSYEVVVAPAAVAFDARQHRDWIWRSYRIDPSDYLSWRDERTLEIRLYSSYRTYFGFIRTRERHGVHVVMPVVQERGLEVPYDVVTP